MANTNREIPTMHGIENLTLNNSLAREHQVPRTPGSEMPVQTGTCIVLLQDLSRTHWVGSVCVGHKARLMAEKPEGLDQAGLIPT